MKRRIHSDVFLGIAVLVFGVVMYAQTIPMPEMAAIFPKMMLIVLMVFGIGILLSGLKKTKDPSEEDPSASFVNIKYPIAFFAIIVLYALSMYYIGFYVSTIVFAVSAMLFFKYRNVKVIIGASVGLVVFLYLMFGLWLNVRMPDALLF